MDNIIFYIFSFLRPVLFIDIEKNTLGLGVFEIAAIVFIGVLFFILMIHLAMRKTLKWSSIDLAMTIYVFWCLGIAIAYPEYTGMKELIKWITPFLTYIVAKNVVKNREEYLRMIFFLVVGASIPLVLSFAFIVSGRGIEEINYWTQLARYEGVYDGSHNLGHNMVLYIVLTTIYVYIKYVYYNEEWKMRKATVVIITMLVVLSVYCLYQSQVRTAYIGLLVFLAILSYRMSKKLFYSGVGIFTLVVILGMPMWKLIFHDVVKVSSGVMEVESIGSGRPFFWKHNLTEYSKMTLDRQIAGAGVGNKYHMFRLNKEGDSFWDSHNDYLEVFIQTGVIGIAIFLILNILIIKKIFAIEGPEKIVFVAIFFAVAVMNFASNSWISRFGLAQLYYLIISYIDVEKGKHA